MLPHWYRNNKLSNLKRIVEKAKESLPTIQRMPNTFQTQYLPFFKELEAFGPRLDAKRPGIKGFISDDPFSALMGKSELDQLWKKSVSTGTEMKCALQEMERSLFKSLQDEIRKVEDDPLYTSQTLELLENHAKSGQLQVMRSQGYRLSNLEQAHNNLPEGSKIRKIAREFNDVIFLRVNLTHMLHEKRTAVDLMSRSEQKDPGFYA